VSIVCEAADRRIFHFELTPDCDATHTGHIHLEIKPGEHSFIVNGGREKPRGRSLARA
jgi:hypothetical protein